MTTKLAKPVANVLPREARDALIAAVAVDPHTPPATSRTRTHLLENAIERVKLTHPTFFQQEIES